MSAGAPPVGKPPMSQAEALRQLQKMVKNVTGSYIEQKGLKTMLTNHWTKVSHLAHVIHNGDEPNG